MPPAATDPSADLVKQVTDELIALRGAHGQLTVQKFSRYPTLIQVCGDGDLMEGYLRFKRELGRFTRGNKFEAAAAWSICAAADSVLDRLVFTADELTEGGNEPRDQRTARHWSDRGMPAIAADLAAIGTIRGTLGLDLIGITVARDDRGTLTVQIVHVTPTAMPSRAPFVTVWNSGDEEAERATSTTNGVEQVEINLEAVMPDYQSSDDDMTTRGYLLRLTGDDTLPSTTPEAQHVYIRVQAQGTTTPMFRVSEVEGSGVVEVDVYKGVTILAMQEMICE